MTRAAMLRDAPRQRRFVEFLLGERHCEALNARPFSSR